MSDADRVDARLTGIEATVDQLDTLNGRMDGMNGRIDDLSQRIDDRFTSLRGDMRRWLYLLLAAVSVAVTAVTAIVQIALAG